MLDGSAVTIASGPDGDPADLVPFANVLLVTQPATCAKREAVCMGMAHAFAEAAAVPLHSLGHHAIRGLREYEEVLGLPEHDHPAG